VSGTLGGAAPAGAMRDTEVLRVAGLTKRYGERVALDDVSFVAHAGELLALIGPNGAGKTTLLSILAGVQRASAGGVRASAGEIGWVPQQPALYSKLTVAENLRLFARLQKVADPDEAVARMLEQTGLAERASSRLESLSGGNRQRVNVAIGLLSDPAVILLDEPFTALDPAQRERLWRFIHDLAERGTCVVFSTHIVSEAARYGARLLVLHEGRLLFDGPPAELSRMAGGDSDFERAFITFLSARPPARSGGAGGAGGAA
jgi:ABC-2 type transport system ATP-binding protein